jgi:hypothetical protein
MVANLKVTYETHGKQATTKEYKRIQAPRKPIVSMVRYRGQHLGIS